MLLPNTPRKFYLLGYMALLSMRIVMIPSPWLTNDSAVLYTDLVFRFRQR